MIAEWLGVPASMALLAGVLLGRWMWSNQQRRRGRMSTVDLGWACFCGIQHPREVNMCSACREPRDVETQRNVG